MQFDVCTLFIDGKSFVQISIAIKRTLLERHEEQETVFHGLCGIAEI